MCEKSRLEGQEGWRYNLPKPKTVYRGARLDDLWIELHWQSEAGTRRSDSGAAQCHA